MDPFGAPCVACFMLRTAMAFVVAASLGVLSLVLPTRYGPDGIPPTPRPDACDHCDVPSSLPAPPPAPEGLTIPAPATPVEAQGVRLRVRLTDRVLYTGSQGDVDLVVDVDGQGASAGPRRPLDLALVIDRSGSMAGEKLANARAAADAVIDRMGPEDRVSVIAYGSDVDVLATRVPGSAAGKRTLHDAVDSIDDSGGTFLSGALHAARKALAGRASPNAVRKMLLLTDGAANEGATDPRSLARIADHLAASGISLSTIGIGPDIDDTELLSLADHAGGHFTWLKGSRGLTRTFLSSVAAARSTVAEKLVLTVTPDAGSRVDTAYGYTATRGPADPAGAPALSVALPDLAAGGHERVVFHLTGNTWKQGTERLGAVHLSWARPLDGFPVDIGTDLKVAVAPGTHPTLAGIDREAMTIAAHALEASTARTAADLYAAGRVSDAQAVFENRLEAIISSRLAGGTPSASGGLGWLDRAGGFRSAPAPESPAGRSLVHRLRQQAMEMSR